MHGFSGAYPPVIFPSQSAVKHLHDFYLLIFSLVSLLFPPALLTTTVLRTGAMVVLIMESDRISVRNPPVPDTL